MGDTIARWEATSPWAAVAEPERYGAEAGASGVRLAALAPARLATIIVRDGREADLDKKMRNSFGIGLPSAGRAHIGPGTDLVWSAPRQWLLVSRGQGDLGAVQTDLADMASVTDQSDGRALLQVSGRNSRDMLAKGFAIDLHETVFQPGSTAVTKVAHIGTQIWQTDAAPTYVLAVARSFAQSFWAWAVSSAAEFGYDVAV